MLRAVTDDHILFNESIDTFRREENNYVPIISGSSNSFILFAFELYQKWDLGGCVVQPSFRVLLPGANSAFICTVNNPD